MAEMFASMSEFKPYVGGAINQSVELDSLAPVIFDAARRHLVPWLGQAFYDAIETGAHPALTDPTRRALALLTMYEYSKVASVEFGESGMFRVETDSRKSAYKYQENQYREYMQEKGYDALEYLLRFLDTNKASYTGWAGSEEGLMHRTPLLNYAADCRRLAQVQVDRFTFECLRPIVADVEAFAVQPLVPAAFWSGLITRHLAGSLTTAEKTLRDLIRTAIAHRTVDEASRMQWVQVVKGRVVVIEEFGESGATNRTSPQQAAVGVKFSTHQTWADRHTSRWVQYIKANAGSFQTVFDTASGGTNTDADAWHINTDEEQAIADCSSIEEKKRPVYQF